jgi:hypothetical protein
VIPSRFPCAGRPIKPADEIYKAKLSMEVFGSVPTGEYLGSERKVPMAAYIFLYRRKYVLAIVPVTLPLEKRTVPVPSA